MKTTRPEAIILSGYGLNCEEETAFAFKSAGVDASIVHVEDVIARPSLLRRYQILTVPGGFSFGDHAGAGAAYANKLANHLSDELARFLERDTLVLGICNGFQILTRLGFLPGSLTHNDVPRYVDRWVDLAVSEGGGPWLEGIEQLSLPIAHGEGKYHIDDHGLAQLKQTGAIASRYARGEISRHFNLVYNPNGSRDDIAGVTAYNGRVLGLMPHPERAMHVTHLPHFTYVRETLRRRGERLPKHGPGLQIFENAYRYYAG